MSATTTPTNQMSHHSNAPPASHRFTAWAALCFFSIVLLVSQLSATRNTGRGADDWFVVVVGIVSSVCSFIALMAYFLMHQKFAGRALEGALAVLTVLFWICGMPIIMDPARGIAVTKGNNDNSILTQNGASQVDNMAGFTFIKNANLFFFSWAATISIVYICGRFARDVVKSRRNASVVDGNVNTYAPKTNLWYILTVTALVIMVDSIQIMRAFDCSLETNAGLCMRTKYAVSLGTISTAIAFTCAALATIGKLSVYAEVGVAIVLFCLHIAGVALITFNEGPGISLGNLYFATWLAAIVALVMMGRTYQDAMHNFKDNHGHTSGVETEGEPLPAHERKQQGSDIESGNVNLTKNDSSVADSDSAASPVEGHEVETEA